MQPYKRHILWSMCKSKGTDALCNRLSNAIVWTSLKVFFTKKILFHIWADNDHDSRVCCITFLHAVLWWILNSSPSSQKLFVLAFIFGFETVTLNSYQFEAVSSGENITADEWKKLTDGFTVFSSFVLKTFAWFRFRLQ